MGISPHFKKNIKIDLIGQPGQSGEGRGVVASSVRLEKPLLEKVESREGPRLDDIQTLVSGHFQRWLLAQINSSQPHLRIGTLHSRRKWTDCGQAFSYKLVKL